ncbi:MAG: carboxypeptidase-like regulatory domain-containing protein [Planctomycetota bacterium]
MREKSNDVLSKNYVTKKPNTGTRFVAFFRDEEGKDGKRKPLGPEKKQPLGAGRPVRPPVQVPANAKGDEAQVEVDLEKLPIVDLKWPALDPAWREKTLSQLEETKKNTRTVTMSGRVTARGRTGIKEAVVILFRSFSETQPILDLTITDQSGQYELELPVTPPTAKESYPQIVAFAEGFAAKSEFLNQRNPLLLNLKLLPKREVLIRPAKMDNSTLANVKCVVKKVQYLPEELRPSASSSTPARFRIPNLLQGDSIAIDLEHETYKDARVEVKVTTGKSAENRIVIGRLQHKREKSESPAVVYFAPASANYFQILDADTRLPRKGVGIRLGYFFSNDRIRYSDENGAIVVPARPHSNYLGANPKTRVHVGVADDFRGFYLRVKPSENIGRPTAIYLPPRLTLNGTVSFAINRPRKARVYWRDAEGVFDPIQAQTDRKGNFQLSVPHKDGYLYACPLDLFARTLEKNAVPPPIDQLNTDVIAIFFDTKHVLHINPKTIIASPVQLPCLPTFKREIVVTFEGRPVANAPIEVDAVSGFGVDRKIRLRTDSSGSVIYQAVVSRIDTVFCSMEREEQRFTASVSGNMIPASGTIHLDLRASKLVRGIVTLDGRPVSRATVRLSTGPFLSGREVKTNSKGEFSMSFLSDANMILNARHGSRLRSQFIDLSTQQNQLLELQLVKDERGRGTRKLRGRVIDGQNQPLDATVRFFETNELKSDYAQTDRRGEFVLAHLPKGEVSIFVQDSNRKWQVVLVEAEQEFIEVKFP